MNIFFTSPDPILCARALDDKRVVKMVLKSAQMLSTVLHSYGVSDPLLYKSTHYNHPVNKWVRESRPNFLWLFDHFQALCEEYTFRYGKVHASTALIPAIMEYKFNIPLGPLSIFPNCARNSELDLDFTHLEVVTAYRTYLNIRWKMDKREPTWTRRGAPKWREE